jgi:predicted ester cyclase
MGHRHARSAIRNTLVAVWLVTLTGCASGGGPTDIAWLREFATRYTAAWCGQEAASVASFFAENGFLKINEGKPSVGRAEIAAAAQGFMTAFPDLVVKMDSVSREGGRVVYRWTLTGTNTGRGGTGRAVQISGYEEWTLGPGGLIAESRGHFDEAEYRRQLNGGRTIAP